MKSKFLPPIYFWSFIVLAVALHFLLPIALIISSPYRYLGGLPIVFGLALNLWTDSLFKKANTTVKPYQKSTAFLIDGPFRISRHPMYLGMTSVLIGVALLCGSLSPFVTPLLFVIVMEGMFIPFEENDLEEAFGEQYSEYKNRVRRWI